MFYVNLSGSILDSVVQLVELQLFRADCHMKFFGKTKVEVSGFLLTVAGLMM